LIQDLTQDIDPGSTLIHLWYIRSQIFDAPQSDKGHQYFQPFTFVFLC